eukprot:TRINITY_DN443_c0_g1_i2.p1 TRINITY_DN443_c0_g1~~TRINITY_DN443_c0_g1_i2.p1  ORF type:complete len:325 (+),score=90.05 TRINITY_DN443_c0_g1_i2:92-1066(+)
MAETDSAIIGWINFFVICYGSIGFLTFVVPLIISTFVYKEQDLKKKYDAKWAIVTGASTGIGRAITEKLAGQGINVVLVALDDQFMKDFSVKIQQDFPKLQFRFVPIDLSKPGYMDAIKKSTDDIPISLVFNNAGYVVIGMFAAVDLEKQLKNIEVNMMVSVHVTHHFLNKMLAAKRKGAVVFTSSPAGGIPTPFSVTYGSTKAFITSFAQSLAGEVRYDGIDVLVVHPSPVDTNFYKSDTAHKSDMLNAFKKAATSPTNIADIMFSSVGRTVIRDQGITTFVFRFLLKLLDINFFADITARTGHITGDFKKLHAEMVNKVKTQ